METIDELHVAEIVRKYPASAALFEKYDIDYCCHGKQTLREACEGDLVKFQKVEHALHRIYENELTNTAVVHFESMDLGELINHIINKHHHYIKEYMPVIEAHVHKVFTKHGQRHPELAKIYELFMEVKAEMEQHMFKEEHILFPRIKLINEAFKEKKSVAGFNNSFLSAPIGVMEMEHEKAGDALHLIRELTNNYLPPEDGCTTHRLTYAELKEFEHDLHQHVHLENNILFPKALEMEALLERLSASN
jgi:regulator of cell morphogenesis and NO signaling